MKIKAFGITLSMVLALGVFGTSALAKESPNPVERIAVQKSVQIGEHQIGYTVWNNEDKKPDRTIVLIHGALTNSYATVELAKTLSADARFHKTQIVQVDLPGHGQSSGPAVPSIEGIADIIGQFITQGRESGEFANRVVPAGVSMGGSVTQQLALNKVKGIDKIILLNTSPSWENFNALSSLDAAFFDANFKALMRSEYAIDTTAEQQAAFESYMELMYPGGEAAVSDVQALIGFNVEDRLDKINDKTLVFGTEDDGTAPFAKSVLLAESIKKAELVSLPTGGHIVLLKKPQWITDRIAEFLGK